MGRLDDRVAIITGSGRGIGAATARLFASEGAAVVVNDVDKDPAQEVVEEISKTGARAFLNTDNTVSSEAAQNLINQALEEFGKIDILVNNAGITRDKTFHNMTDEMWDFILDVNLRTAFNNTRATVVHMREAAKKEQEEFGAPAYHRKITFTSSTAGISGNAGQANYTTAKMGLIGLTRTLCAELGRFHINVNAVAPGFIETRLTVAKEESADPDLGIPLGDPQHGVDDDPAGVRGPARGRCENTPVSVVVGLGLRFGPGDRGRRRRRPLLTGSAGCASFFPNPATLGVAISGIKGVSG